MTLGVIVYLVYRLGQLGWADLLAALPTSPWFYALFLVIYLTQPLAELITYRQIWPVPSWSGLRALIRKRVFNEEMAGYSGEVYFFWWLYKKLGVARTEAFRAVRDVNILSSVASMTTAAALLAVLGGSGILELNKIFGDVSQAQFLIGLGLAIALGAVLYQFRTYLFALPKPTAYRILGIHYGRLIVVNGLFVVQWSVGVPDIGLVVWLTYLCLLIVLNRVPFLPSKDLFFLSLGMGLSDSLGQATTAIAGMLLASSVLVRTTNFGLFLATHFSEDPDVKNADAAFASSLEDENTVTAP